ncbi:uncharacterized protein LOC115469387 [Microcaecilia unicolor]|uniref:Uncharacterized protein LOC115469387 n=1 Tax=Microcaecilia unicolor TaxID=1415580 RepID=A0A6P7Y442_9AMPH|nr:uncharacterized protein LOC115469387 [Microcaecilia unicolor]
MIFSLPLHIFTHWFLSLSPASSPLPLSYLSVPICHPFPPYSSACFFLASYSHLSILAFSFPFFLCLLSSLTFPSVSSICACCFLSLRSHSVSLSSNLSLSFPSSFSPRLFLLLLHSYTSIHPHVSVTQSFPVPPVTLSLVCPCLSLSASSFLSFHHPCSPSIPISLSHLSLPHLPILSLSPVLSCSTLILTFPLPHLPWSLLLPYLQPFGLVLFHLSLIHLCFSLHSHSSLPFSSPSIFFCPHPSFFFCHSLLLVSLFPLTFISPSLSLSPHSHPTLHVSLSPLTHTSITSISLSLFSVIPSWPSLPAHLSLLVYLFPLTLTSPC